MGTPDKDAAAAGGTTRTPPAPAQRKDGAPADATTPARKRARKRRPQFVL